MGKLAINDDGWRTIIGYLDAQGVAERMGLSTDRVERVLSGESRPTVQFIAQALLSFPMRFSDLFTVVI